MRALILLAGAAFTLAACGDGDQTGNVQTLDDSLTAENIVANDVTAIDAVTGADANMAADVDIDFTNELIDPARNDISSGASPTTAAPLGRSGPPPRAPVSRPSVDERLEQGATNSAEADR
jgi:hypothetical protein